MILISILKTMTAFYFILYKMYQHQPCEDISPCEAPFKFNSTRFVNQNLLYVTFKVSRFNLR